MVKVRIADWSGHNKSGSVTLPKHGRLANSSMQMLLRLNHACSSSPDADWFTPLEVEKHDEMDFRVTCDAAVLTRESSCRARSHFIKHL